MDARLARALSRAAHDILSCNSTIKTLAARLKGDETSKVILDASSKIHRLANELQQYAVAGANRIETPVAVSGADLAAMAEHRFGIACDRAENLANAPIHPGKLLQVLEILGGILESARTRVNALKLTPGVKLVLQLENHEMLEDSIALLLCETLMESMRGKLVLREGEIELFIPENAR